MSKKQPKAYTAKLSDFTLHRRNLNKHTQRGQGMVETSQRQRGFARPGFAAKDGTVLGGNLSTLEVPADIGLGDGEIFVIESDGTIPIVHKRIDLDPDSEEAALLAAEDNRSSEVGISWDAERVLDEIESGVNFSPIFTDDELAELEEEAMLALELSEALLKDAGTQPPRNLGDKKKQIKPVLYVDEVAVFEDALRLTGEQNRGQALIQICRYYLEETKGQLDL